MNEIDHNDESLMRYHFTTLADDMGITRRDAELLFRNNWEKIRRFGPHRATTFRKMIDLLEAS